MSLGSSDLGVLGDLGKALGLFQADGSPNQGFFAHPEDSLKNMLASESQRAALIAFVDEALGGADRTTEDGVIWLPIVDLDDPRISVALTIDEGQSDGLHIGVGLRFSTTDPASATTLAVPLFRAQKEGGPSVTQPFLLGSPGGRLRLSTSITVDAAPPLPGQPRLGAIGLEVDVPTSDADGNGPIFGLSLSGLQLPGATAPRDVHVVADGTGELDDALLELVLALVKAQADAPSAGSALAAVAGLLGLRSGDNVPDFPITQLPARGAMALADWVRGILTTEASRDDWLDHLASLLAGTRTGDSVAFNLGGAAVLTLQARIDAASNGNPRLTLGLGVELGDAHARAAVVADIFRIDLVTADALALPRFGIWAAAGTHASPLLDSTTAPVVHADTLRVGFELDAARRLNFVLAADGVTLGTHGYATLDLTSPNAVMDAIDNTVSDVANELLGGLGDALDVIGQLIGIHPPAGVTAVTLPSLMTDPLAAVGGYWQALVSDPVAVRSVLNALLSALADATQSSASVTGSGSADDPWRVPLIGPLRLELVSDGSVLTLGLAAATSVDTLGQRCTVVETRIAATLARIDLAARHASLMTGVEGLLTARERGADPKRARLVLDNRLDLTADYVGLRLAWSPDASISAEVAAPSLTLNADGTSLPITLPSIGADGSLSMPPEAWRGVEVLVGHFARLIGGFFQNAVRALGWIEPRPGEVAPPSPRLGLNELVTSPDIALRNWLFGLLLSDLAPHALALLADLFGGNGPAHAVLAGSGSPDDPYRFGLGPALPMLALSLPPAGLSPVLNALPPALAARRPGQPGLSSGALAAALTAAALALPDVRELIEGRDVAGGLAALSERWVGGDGRIVPPPSPPAGVDVRRVGFSAPELFTHLELEDLLGRTPTTAVFVAVGASAWPDVAAERRVDLTGAGRDASMFTLPAAATGNWYVALGTRGDCLANGSTTDGTPEQAARLARFLATLGSVSSDIALVALDGAGHAARVAAQAELHVTDLVTLGTPLSPIALTALSSQPTADALRLLHRLLPADSGTEANADLELGRGLVESMLELVPLADPSAELRPSSAPLDPPRAGLNVVALFGAVAADQVSRAVTAIVTAGLAERAGARVTPSPARAVEAGLFWPLAGDAGSPLAITGSAALRLVGCSANAGLDGARVLRVRLRIADRLGWLASTPDLELRAVSVDLGFPLGGGATGDARLTLHDARVFGQSWEALELGNFADGLPVLPEARVLLSSAVQRVTADTSSTLSVALKELLAALGIVDGAGGVVGDAVDQLVHDPCGLVRSVLTRAGAALGPLITTLLGVDGGSVDLPARVLRVTGGAADQGRFGFAIDAAASPAGVSGTLTIGPTVGDPTEGGLELRLELEPFRITLVWHQSSGHDATAELWPAPKGSELGALLAKAAPSLGAQVALEIMRRADDSARPVIDAALDGLGLLRGAPGDADRTLRPLAGLLADPAGWLRSERSLASSPLKIQALFDALRPLMGLGGAAGDALPVATGVSLAVAADGAGARLSLDVDSAEWTAPGDVTSRLGAGVGATLSLFPSGPPAVGLELHVGLPGAAAGRQAIYARIGTSGLEVFLRPATGADISLVPFAGLGVLSAVAQAALPYLFDRLAEIAGTPGELVRTLGDALALRGGNPKKFSADALQAWASDPVGALTTAVPSIIATGLTTLAPLLDDFLPAAVTATATASELSVAVAGVTLAWNPSAGRVSLAAPALSVPGVDSVGLRLAISAAGLDELSVALGPARIDAGGVLLRPFASVSAGVAPAGGRRVALGLSADDTHHFALRFNLDTASFELVASDGPLATAVDSTDPAQVALRVVEVVLDLVAAVAMAQSAVQTLLDTTVGHADVRGLLQGVVLADLPHPTALIDQLFVPERWLGRVHRLFANIAGAGISIEVDGFRLTFTEIEAVIGIEVGVVDRFELVNGDVKLWLENDVKWITPRDSDDGGLFVGFLPTAEPLRFTPTLVVNGLGLRLGKSSGPLLDEGISLESVAFHVYAAISAAGATSGGAQLQFSNLAVSASGAQGDNGIAQGVMRDTGPTPPKPAFSPALAVQAHDGGPVAVSLQAGDPPGPWWVGIRRGFGPLYIEQIGFNATTPAGRLERISLLFDGSVSLFGLTAAVDDLSITYIASNNDFFDAKSWAVDLAGLAVSANMAGVSLAGGLLKQTTDAGIEYLGMLLGRFAVYGLTVFGGYGEGQDASGKFTAFFAIGAINGPIGGPPAFFLTGIGGGFGINRKLVIPTELGNFANYPLIQALDIAAQPSDPMQELRQLGQYFPMQKGTFWFAAGLSFNSFALVDGIAVIGVQIGDGLDIDLLGLARMALPRPQAPLVSIELALLVRFSSSEGVLWVQGQLTDNSWLLYRDIKLTGGFAYVIWFKGDKAGEFVLTLGGYHPSFHRDGYPVVPRLGLHWSIGDNIVIEAGNYFALTSEALMAGGDFQASASFGPAWAEVKFGADGIIYFDPFSYDVSAYARIAAGVTIDLWLFGEVTISVSLGARIHVLGPEFRGSVTFDVGPISLTFAFGGEDKVLPDPLPPAEFVTKYLTAGDDGQAAVHAVMTNTGSLPAKGEDSTPDGSAARPFVVTAEFALVFTTTVPATRVTRVAALTTPTTDHAPSHALGVAPCYVSAITPEIELSWLRDGATLPFPFDATARPFGRFPAGVWGPPQDADNRPVPKGEMIEALSELDLSCSATPSTPGPEIAYFQVEIGRRRPLPFTRSAADVGAVRDGAERVTALVTQPVTTAEAFAAAGKFLATTASPTALAALRGERQSPPRLGSLTEGLESPTASIKPGAVDRPAPKTYDHFIDPPVVVGLLSGAPLGLSVGDKPQTSVQGSSSGWRRTPPTLASVDATRSRSIAARLTLTETPAMTAGQGTTLFAATSVPATAQARGASAVVARHGSALPGVLVDFGSALVATGTAKARASSAGSALPAGQAVVLKLPNARADADIDAVRPQLAVNDASARVVLLGHGGRRVADVLVGPGAAASTLEVPRGTERIIALGQGDSDAAASPNARVGLAGWHAGMQLPYAGWATALGPGCVVHSVGDRLMPHRERREAGWVIGAELTRGTSTVTTTFSEKVLSVVIALDDPAAAGQPVAGRRLVLGLDGAARAVDGAGVERAPVLLTLENRSVLAYDIVPDGTGPVVVTIATQQGWSLVAVLASDRTDAKGALALVAARGLDAALAPLFNVSSSAARVASRLAWLGPVRSADERKRAKALARGRGGQPAPAPPKKSPPPSPKKPTRPKKTKGRR